MNENKDLWNILRHEAPELDLPEFEVAVEDFIKSEQARSRRMDKVQAQREETHRLNLLRENLQEEYKKRGSIRFEL